MKCEWQAFMSILPPYLQQKVDRLDKNSMQELRLRIGEKPEAVCKDSSIWISHTVTREDISFCINAASRYSPWNATTIAQGFLTAQGGHRIGICGVAAVVENTVKGIREPTSICIRIARDFPGISKNATDIGGSILLLGPPGSGKTTLLRDIIRNRGEIECVGVVDERGELFPTYAGSACFYPGKRTDILSGCHKQQGIEQLLRTMNPSTIAVDEITADSDCSALIKAGWCGVNLLATAHAGSLKDLYSRPVYKPLLTSRLFERVLVMRKDKSYHEERLQI